MRLDRVALSNFRNYSTLELALSSGVNVFLGENAQGKSNLLEAIAMLGTGKSFRTTRDAEVIREGLELASIAGTATMRAGSVHLSCTVTRGARGTRKVYTVNGQAVRYAAFLGRAKVVTFVPADLHLIDGAPSGRRGLLNSALAQDDVRYFRHLARYQRAVQQKAALLRSGEHPDAALLQIYDEAIVEIGTELMLARDHFVRELAREAERAHAHLAPHERLTVRYHPNVPFEGATRDAVITAFRARLRERAAAEAQRATCLVGPHRDDLVLELDARALDVFGSQGQKRTAVLALKIAEYTVMRDRNDEAPLLLLDDVLSELDDARARALVAVLAGAEQAFVTATHLPPELQAARRFRIVAGAVEAA